MDVKEEKKSPVYNVIAVPVEKVTANDYNPNVVAPPEMKLLELSIWEDGFTMPCVCYYDKENDKYIIVDGFHRYTVLKTSRRIFEREKGMLPVVVIDKDLSNRISSTIRHNRARVHTRYRTDDTHRRRTYQRRNVRPMDHAEHRHGPGRTAPSETDIRPCRTVH